MPPSLADVAREVVGLAGITSILEFWHEWLLLDPTVPANEHGRLDVVYTCDEARARAVTNQTSPTGQVFPPEPPGHGDSG